MKKNLTVGMPLAVPTQKRPPDKYASHPYPVFVDEDVYLVSIAPSNITLKQVLKDILFRYEAYETKVKPLDVMLRSLTIEKHINDMDSFTLRVTPLDVKLKSTLVNISIGDDMCLARVKPLSIVFKRVLVENVVKNDDKFLAAVTPLNITLKMGM